MSHLFQRAVRDEQGSVVTLFALALLPVVGAAAVALDYSKATRDRAELQRSVDAAALGAVGRGAIYTPTQGLTVTGNNFGRPNASMPIIVDQVKFTGSSTLRATS